MLGLLDVAAVAVVKASDAGHRSAGRALKSRLRMKDAAWCAGSGHARRGFDVTESSWSARSRLRPTTARRVWSGSPKGGPVRTHTAVASGRRPRIAERDHEEASLCRGSGGVRQMTIVSPRISESVSPHKATKIGRIADATPIRGSVRKNDGGFQRDARGERQLAVAPRLAWWSRLELTRA